MPKDIPFARIALEKEADAINLWIGNHRSVTSLHKGNISEMTVVHDALANAITLLIRQLREYLLSNPGSEALCSFTTGRDAMHKRDRITASKVSAEVAA